METPTISAKQQRKTLSAKKTKKQTIKTVLVNVYQEYWPLLTEEHKNALKTILENNLPLIRPKRPKILYNEIKDIPKSERKQFRYNLPCDGPKLVDKAEVSLVILGINSVTKSLENNEVAAIAIENCQPKMLIQHLIDHAVLKNIPILILAGLKNIVKEVTGVSSAAIGLKKSLKSESKISLITQKINELSNNYPIPTGHIHYQRRVQERSSSQNIDLTKSSNDLENVLSTSYEISEAGCKNSEDNSVGRNYVDNIYLKRESRRSRVFRPRLSKKIEEPRPDRMVADDSLFIPFSQRLEAARVNRPPEDNETNYRRVIVKRLKGDSNRNKRKLENINVKQAKKKKFN